MRKAGKKRSLWAPLSSSAIPSDSHPPADIPKAPARPAETTRDRLDERSPAAAAGRPDYRNPKSHLSRPFTERWGRSYDSRSSWEEGEGEGEGEDEDEDEGEGEDCGLLGEVSHRYKMASWSGQPDIKGRTEWVRMMLLCAVHFGITFTWGVEMTYCTPYLLNLGLTKSQTSLVWIAGPLSGLITQPIVGALADSSRSRWGRRRPYIVVGAVIVAGGLITLGWTKELVSLVMATDTDFAKMFIIFLAVLALYVTDFAINAGMHFQFLPLFPPESSLQHLTAYMESNSLTLAVYSIVMSCSRSLLVDTLPIAKQQAGAAWAGRMGSLGHIVGYGMGAVDLPGTFGTWLGSTQFQQLTLIAALGILFTSGTTCWAVTERVLITPASSRGGGDGGAGSRIKVLRQIWSTTLDLPPRIQGICWAVFWGWIGWFPFNVYSSTWVGETYFRYDAAAASASATASTSDDALGDMGRIGSYTLTIYSFMTFAGAWLLPLLVRAPEDEGYTARPPERIAHLVRGLERARPDLLTVWVVGHALFAGAMVFAPFATSFRFATALVVFCGIREWILFPTFFLLSFINRT